MFMDSFKEIYAEFHRLSFSASDSGGSSVVAYFEAMILCLLMVFSASSATVH